MSSLTNKAYPNYDNQSNFTTTIFPIYYHYLRNFYFFDQSTGDCKSKSLNYIPDEYFRDYEECLEECIKTNGKF